jgi:hypothetical protein
VAGGDGKGFCLKQSHRVPKILPHGILVCEIAVIQILEFDEKRAVSQGKIAKEQASFFADADDVFPLVYSRLGEDLL